MPRSHGGVAAASSPITITAKVMRSITLLLCLSCVHLANAYTPQDGDIVFHTSTSSQSAAVQAATGSRYSHMGLVLLRDGRPYVLEAVQPVRYTPLQTWLDRGLQGRYVIKRPAVPLTQASKVRLHAAASTYVGRPYDLTFEWSDQRIYCSELVWKLYRDAAAIELAPLARLASFDLQAPAVRAKLFERYGGNIPLDEPVISPAAIFDSPLLVPVAQR
ncbi:YiiX family permuted papain-like enzyme [Stenotrophomonas sp.]|uniref:YiiX family permuted papain-like enzyme n=1 Tax=Stenotrophomonas sp. TaxID=69392 RepID=UPI0028A013A8|nr:YiiX family permuted papain-like enzyme [Stenotrophomonas sp.]